MLIYLVISLIYQLALTESIKALEVFILFFYFVTTSQVIFFYPVLFSDFDAIAAYCTKYTSTIPILLLLGFFTSTSMQVINSNSITIMA